MINKLFFSVCVPVYNVEKYVSECIESVLKQTYHFFELILVDDGSQDESLMICKKYENVDNRIKVYSKVNEGQIATRNYAFSKASGNVILCLDSDDFLELETLDKLNQYFLEYNCDCVYYNWKRFSKDKFYLEKKIDNRIELIKDKRLLFKKIFEDMYYNSMCLKAFKRELIPQKDDSFFHKIRRGEDLFQTIEILDKSESVLFVPDVFYNYRINLDSVSYNRSIKLYVPGNLVRLFIYKFLKEKNIYTQKDWDIYGKFCALHFLKILVMISNLDASIKEKILLFKQEYESEYYSNFLVNYKTGALAKDILLMLFKWKRFFLLLNLLIIKKVVR